MILDTLVKTMSTHIYKALFSVKKNQVQMIQDRGYDVGDEYNLLDYNLESFIDLYEGIATDNQTTIKDVLGNTYYKDSSEAGRSPSPLKVIYLETPTDRNQIGKAQVSSIIEGLEQAREKITHVIFIGAVGLSQDARKLFIKIPSYRIETFLYEDLMYNPTKHYLVPQHRILSPEEVRELKLQPSKCPLISVFDPIARYYGAIPGMMMEISRIDLTGIGMVSRSLFYRLVVNRPLTLNKTKTSSK